jgi:hypothetical protein
MSCCYSCSPHNALIWANTGAEDIQRPTGNDGSQEAVIPELVLIGSPRSLLGKILFLPSSSDTVIELWLSSSLVLDQLRAWSKISRVKWMGLGPKKCLIMTFPLTALLGNRLILWIR